MGGVVYILAKHKNGALYIGVTNDIGRRVWEHREGRGSRHTSKYDINRLVYYQYFDDISDAIAEEKRLKAWRRSWKIALIEKGNPEWRDLYYDLNKPSGVRMEGWQPPEA
ncbi:MAG: GIY-YIG nuclease family protein [Aquisalinus sp.]|nr:GIY-YIG nuclease family protein [Aquisalinus sp.]